LKAGKDEFGLVSITNHFDTPEAKISLYQRWNNSVGVYNISEKRTRYAEIQKTIEDKLKDVKVEYSITGEEFIKNDYIQVTFAGVDKSAVITVLFILVVLFLVFRSIVTPLVSLFTVGISYLCSMGIVSQLIFNMDFPVTSLTRMFIILILFGIGTDYNILLFNRFKEELGRQNSR
jgi:RND superfamily putative drug exporter